MKMLDVHQTNPANARLKIHVDAPGQGGASRLYVVSGFDTITNDSRDEPPQNQVRILFQNGPVSKEGNNVNGVTHEVLLAILIDRLMGFQEGPYRCAENEQALHHCRGALLALQSRTDDRLARGVEGTHEV